MGILDKLHDYLETANNTKEQYLDEMERKTDKQLIEIAKSGGTSAQAIGRKKAALEVLSKRGYNI